MTHPLSFQISSITLSFLRYSFTSKQICMTWSLPTSFRSLYPSPISIYAYFYYSLYCSFSQIPIPYVHMRLNAPHDIFCFTYYVVGQNGRLLRYSPHLLLTSIYHLLYLFTLFITMNLPVWVVNSVLYLLCSISSFNVFCTYVVSIQYSPLSQHRDCLSYCYPHLDIITGINNHVFK